MINIQDKYYVIFKIKKLDKIVAFPRNYYLDFRYLFAAYLQIKDNVKIYNDPTKIIWVFSLLNYSKGTSL